MAAEPTDRLGIYRWTSGSDPFTREQMDVSHEELEDRVAGFSQAGARPAASLAYKGFFHYSAGGQLSYCNGSSWDDLAVENTTDGNIGEIDGTASAGTSASGLAYAEHKHSIAASTITNAMIVSLDAAKLTGTLDAARIADSTITDAMIVGIDAAKVSGVLTTEGNAATATKLAAAVNIGGVPFDGSVAIDLPGVNTAGTQDTDGNAATADDATNAAKVAIAAESADAPYNVTFVNGTTGNKSVKVDSGLTYNPSSNKLTAAGGFVGALEGDAETASRWANSITLRLTGGVTGSVSFNGSETSIVDLPTSISSVSVDAYNLQGGTLAPGVISSSLTSLGTITNLGAGTITTSGNVTVGGSLYVTSGGTTYLGATTVSGLLNVSSQAKIEFGNSNDQIRYDDTDNQFEFWMDGSKHATLGNPSIWMHQSGGTLLASSPPSGTGNDAEWAVYLGTNVLYQNTSVAADKENISADLGTHLTADMIDSVVPKMWNRITAPGIPEIGPIADEVDEVSPFLASHGTDANDEQVLTGINKTAWMSLLTLAVKDLRTRIAALEP